MCGIAGISLSSSENLPVRELSRRLLLAIEHRGQAATGFAARGPGIAGIVSAKRAVPATAFVKDRGFGVGPQHRCVILHARRVTKGTSRRPANNHPIVTHGGRIVGIHNGTIWNDDDLFAANGMRRLGTVDSEAIFASLAGLAGNDREAVVAVMKVIEGTAALAWFDALDDDPQGCLHLARVADSPLHLARTRLGSTIFASTAEAITAATTGIVGVEAEEEIAEGTYLRLRAGSVLERRRFVPQSGVGGWGLSGLGRRPNHSVRSIHPSGRRAASRAQSALQGGTR